MFCENCGKENNELDKFCSNCGAKLSKEKTNETQTNDNKSFVESTEVKQELKKKGGFWKTFLIVCLVVLIVISLLVGASVGFYKILKANFSESIKDYKHDYSDGFDDFDDDDFDDFDFDDDFAKFFDEWEDDYFDNYDLNKTYAGTDKFKAGTINKNTYNSTFASLSFTLPVAWEIYDQDKINDMGTAYQNKLFLYDLYAVNSFDGSAMSIAFYNKEYFNISSLDKFNEQIKNSFKNVDDDEKVDIAKDSKITLCNNSYVELACRVTGDDETYYLYEFTREIDGYFVEISLMSYDLDTIGDMIDILNSKG